MSYAWKRAHVALLRWERTLSEIVAGKKRGANKVVRS